MSIKRFFAKTTSEALRKVRDSLGPEGVILSNRSVDGGIEILAHLFQKDQGHQRDQGRKFHRNSSLMPGPPDPAIRRQISDLMVKGFPARNAVVAMTGRHTWMRCVRVNRIGRSSTQRRRYMATRIDSIGQAQCHRRCRARGRYRDCY